jgi:hypothetical protein
MLLKLRGGTEKISTGIHGQKVGTEEVRSNCGLWNDECGLRRTYSATPVRNPKSPPDLKELTRRAHSAIVHLIFIFTGFTFQIFAAYSRIDLSDENPPIRATFRIDIFVQRAWSR